MNKKFKFVTKQYCVFKDEGIICKKSIGKCYIPYASITKIYVDTDRLVIKTNSDNIEFRTILLRYGDSIDKQELRECSEFAETRKSEQDAANNNNIEPKTRIISKNVVTIIKRKVSKCKNIGKIFAIVCLTLVIMLLALALGLSNNSQKDKFKDTFDKDPNSWTEEEKDYVNDLFDWIGENEE